MPTERELAGDFSQSSTNRVIFNPYTTRTVNGVSWCAIPFPGNVIPQNLISPTMQAFLRAYMVQPNIPGNVRDNFRACGSRRATRTRSRRRVDHHFSTSDNIFFRWTERRINAFIPRGDRGFQEPDSINRNYGGGWFHSFSPTMVLEVRGGLATQPTEDAPFQHELGVAPQQSLNLPELDQFYGYVMATVWINPWTDMPMLGVQGPRPRENPNWNAAADLTWLRGKHNFKFGFQMLQISRLQTNQFGSCLQQRSDAQPASRPPTPAIRWRPRCWGCPRDSGRSCPISATSTSTPPRSLATSRISGR